MGSLSDSEKLRIRLAHWMEHNLEHAEEFERCAAQAKSFGSVDAASKLKSAAKEMRLVNHSLNDALSLLGGPLTKAE